jgi:hypothetical protein
MQFSTLVVTLFASLVAAAPSLEMRQGGTVCNQIEHQQCCQADGGKIVDVSCQGRMSNFLTSKEGLRLMIGFIVTEPAVGVGEFKSICSATGKSAACCFVPMAVQPPNHPNLFLSLTKINSLAVALFATRCKGIISKYL